MCVFVLPRRGGISFTFLCFPGQIPAILRVIVCNWVKRKASVKQCCEKDKTTFFPPSAVTGGDALNLIRSKFFLYPCGIAQGGGIMGTWLFSSRMFKGSGEGLAILWMVL